MPLSHPRTFPPAPKFGLFAYFFFVNLERFAGFLYIKAVWEIEDFQGYG